MVELLCLLLPFGLGALWYVVPSAVDLVRQDERVGLWWVVGLAPIVPWVMLALLVPVLMPPGVERVTTTGLLWTVAWLAGAACLVLMSMGLAIARGLRPGGETERRFRTTLGAAITLVFASVGPVIAIPIAEEAAGLLWLLPAAWGGLFWVLLLNRRGPARLEHGKRVSATWLMAAGLLFVTAVLLALRAFAIQDGPDVVIWSLGIAAILGAVAMIAGLRFLAGPPHRLTIGLALGANVTLLIPELYLFAFRPLPPGHEAPAWVDVAGRPAGNSQPVWRQTCIRILPADRTVGQCGPYGDADVLAPPELRMVELTAWGDFLVDDGRSSVWITEPDPAGPAQVVPVEGGWRVDGRVETTPEGLIQALTRLQSWEPVSIEITDTLTVQEYIQICASSVSGSCRAVRQDPDAILPIAPDFQDVMKDR